jgi:hypothetical protein
MKAMLFCALAGIALTVNAQDPQAVSRSQAEAVREFPALAQPGSEFNRRFVERFKSLKAAGDSLLKRDDWPEVLAKEVGVEYGVAPVSPVAASTPTAMPYFRSDASQLGGFMGMAWGTPMDKAKALMLSREGTTFDTAESTDMELCFTGGTFSGYAVQGIILTFYEGGLCEAAVLFSPSSTDEAEFSDLQTALEKKYGNAEGNVYSQLARWEFPNGKEELSLILGSSLGLTYSNLPLAAKAEEVRKQKLGTKDL